MATLKVFKAGNSHVVSLDRELAERYGLELGVCVVQKPSEGGILIKPVKEKSTVPSDLRKWLTAFEKKHGRALKELARR